jgi:hypothetical protein
MKSIILDFIKQKQQENNNKPVKLDLTDFRLGTGLDQAVIADSLGFLVINNLIKIYKDLNSSYDEFEALN